MCPPGDKFILVLNKPLIFRWLARNRRNGPSGSAFFDRWSYQAGRLRAKTRRRFIATATLQSEFVSCASTDVPTLRRLPSHRLRRSCSTSTRQTNVSLPNTAIRSTASTEASRYFVDALLSAFSTASRPLPKGPNGLPKVMSSRSASKAAYPVGSPLRILRSASWLSLITASSAGGTFVAVSDAKA